MDELALLQAVRLKGRVRAADLAATLGADEDAVVSAVRELIAAHRLTDGHTMRLTPDGRTRLSELLTEERRGLDAAAFGQAYDQFRGVNREFKTLVTDWQLRNGEPNDHGDDEYDAAVLRRVDDVHRAVLPILASVTAQLPRLDAYVAKLSGALEKVRGGETTWLTRPVVESYHTVWFELHEELIGAAGLTRHDEDAQ